MRSQNVTYLPGIDHIRAFASILIVLFHTNYFMATTGLGGGPRAGQWVEAHNPLHALVLEGHTAVSLFIVLSGFLFTMGSLRREVRYRGFLRNRLLRIYPLFVALIAAGIATTPKSFEMVGFLQTLFGLANLDGALDLKSWSAMFWTVAVECQLYLLFPFLLAFLNRDGIRPLCLLIAGVVVLRTLAAGLGGDMHQLTYWTVLGRLDQFLIGMLGAVYVRSRRDGEALPAWSFGLATLAVVLLVDRFNAWGGWKAVDAWRLAWPTLEAAAWCGFVVTYLSVAPRLPALLSRGLVGIGVVSYSTYLLHFPILHTLVARRWFLTPDLGFDALVILNGMLLFVPVVIGISTITYFAIERPFLALRGSYHVALDERDTPA